MKINRMLSVAAVGAVAAGLVPLVTATPALADTATQLGFESFTPGSPNGQQGWKVTNGAFDYSIVNSGGLFSGALGSKALRMSNAVTSGSFGDQLFSVETADEAGETSAENGGLSGGTRQQRFTASFLFGSAVPGSYQDGLMMGVSPDRGDGARMGLVRMYDKPAGLEVTVFTVDPVTTDFTEHVVATGLDRTKVHRLVMTEDFVDGEDNDLFSVSVDDAAPVSGSSWEEYFRDGENNLTRTVDSLLFRASVPAPNPANVAGKGFLVDNVVLTTGPASPASGSTVVWGESQRQAGDFFSNYDHDLPGSSSASAKFVPGPGTAPLGMGSYQLSTGPLSGANNGKWYVGKQMTGQLSDLTALSYASWVSPSNATNAQPYVNVTFYGNGGYGNLVYDPIDPANGPQSKGQWKTQNAFSPTAIWTATRNLPGIPKGTRATWADFMAAMPGATFYPVVGGVFLVAGSSGQSAMWTSFVGAVDALKIGVAGVSTTYDFDNWYQCPSTTNISTKTVTLTGDCTTSEPLTLDDQWTLDGAEHTITAVDPSGGTFTGAVLTNGSPDADPDTSNWVTVKNLDLVGDLAEGCSGSLFGLRLSATSASVTHSTIADIRYGAGSGCQSGNSLDITNTSDSTRYPVTVDDVHVTGFQKTGIRANGSVALTLKNSSVADAELDMITASNSLQISRGARANVTGNTIGGNDWDGDSRWSATGVLMYDPGAVTFSRNMVTGTDTDFGLYAYDDGAYTTGQVSITCNLFQRASGVDSSPTPGQARDLWSTGVATDGSMAGALTLAGNTVTGFATAFDGVTNEVGGPCAPGPVTGFDVTGGTSSVTAAWAAPAVADYAPVTGYDVTLVPGGATQHVTGTTATFAGLSEATEYSVTVVPVNAAGNGTSATASGTTAPGDASISATNSTADAVSVNWSVPGTAYTSFDVVLEHEGTVVDSASTAGDARSWVFTGLDADTEYDVTVTPRQGPRSGAADTTTVSTLAAPVVPQAPLAVTGLSASSATPTSLTAGWTASSGATGYDVTLLPGGTVQHVTGTTATFSGLASLRTYTVTVVPVNAAGSGAARSASLYGTKVVTTVSAKTVKSGKTFTVSGQVTDDAGQRVAGQSVTLFARVKGTTTYTSQGVKAVTAANGTFTFKVRTGVTKRFYVMTSGPDHMAASSVSWVVKAKATATMKLDQRSVVHGHKVVFSGKIAPKAGAVALQRLVGRSWVTVRSVSTVDGRYAIGWTPASTKDYSWRVRVSGSTFLAAASPSKVLRVS